MIRIGAKVIYIGEDEDRPGKIMDVLKDSEDDLAGYIIKLDNGTIVLSALDEVAAET